MEELDQSDWDNLLVDLPIPDDDVFLNLEEYDATTTGISGDGTTTVESWIEELLMKDDDQYYKNNNNQVAALASGDDFTWSDLLVDYPQGSSDASPSPPLPHPSPPPPPISNSPASCSNSDDNVVQVTIINCTREDFPNFESNGKSGYDDHVLKLDDTYIDDPLSKKRKRQLRNRDAAMKSRERKKMYVKDLEMKSRSMEAECRRLGRLLQCCYAENQMLRISLGSAYGASLAKPESAVLLLESLLLVSLVWVMVNICLLPLPELPLFNQDAVPLTSMKKKELGSAAPKGKGTKVTKLWVTLPFMRSKRCRASRIKMKSDFDSAMLCN